MATESDNVNSGALLTLLFVGAFATLGIGLVVTALVRSETTEEAEKKEVGADRPYRDLVAEQTAKMAAPAAYVDRGRGLVSLPIDRAMEVTVSGLLKDPNSATPPAPIGGTGGASATDTGGTTAALGGTTAALGGTSSGGMPANPAAPTDSAAVEVAKPAEGSKDQGQGKPTEKEKPGGKGDQPEKKAAPKKVAPQPVPATPAPATPAPAAPAPNAP